MALDQRPVSGLAPNPKNPRTITDEKLAMLRKSLAEYGDLGAIVFNRKSKQLVGGHQRVKLLSADAKVTITRKFEKPTRVGTVAEGFVTFDDDGERFKYREVSWSKQKEMAANIAANKGAGDWDHALLTDWMKELEAFDSGFDMDLTMFDEAERTHVLTGDEAKEVAELYSKKIQSPVYEPKGEKPKLSELVDSSKALGLIEEIQGAKIPEGLKRYLVLAAHRHVVFNYEKAAEYYAHAPAEVQSLMERSALVIIDFKKAVENGFVVLSTEIAAAYASDYA